MNRFYTLKHADTNSPILGSVFWIQSVVIPVLYPLVTVYGMFNFCDFQWMLCVVYVSIEIIPLLQHELHTHLLQILFRGSG